MFKKLEDRKLETYLGKNPSVEADCGCSCKTVKAVDEKASPEGVTAIILASVHFDLNG